MRICSEATLPHHCCPTPPPPFQLHHTHTTSHMMYFYFHMVVQTQIRMSYVMLCAKDAMASKEEKRVFLWQSALSLARNTSALQCCVSCNMRMKLPSAPFSKGLQSPPYGTIMVFPHQILSFMGSCGRIKRGGEIRCNWKISDTILPSEGNNRLGRAIYASEFFFQDYNNLKYSHSEILL